SMVIVFTAETPDMQRQINLAWEYILPGVKKQALTTDKAAQRALDKKLRSLQLAIPERGVSSDREKAVLGKAIRLEKNELDLEEIVIRANGSGYEVSFKIGSDVYPLEFGSGKWIFG